MPPGKRILPGIVLPALMLLSACSGGGGSTHNSSPRTDIDLSVTDFSVTPSAADAEDPLTLSGTIHNLGTETANPVQGDKFYVRFNLSTDGTFELNEEGFLQLTVTDPIPAGGSLPFSCTPPACFAPYSGGDTFAIFGNFCNSDPQTGCVPPETGVVGVKVDSTNGINEIEEGNNFQFLPIEVVGTRVAATQGVCDFGLPGVGQSGCDLTVTDGLYTTSPPLHRPCSSCGNGVDIVLPNEIHPRIFVTLSIKGCTNNVCGGSWLIVATTEKPGLTASTLEFPLSCNAYLVNGPDASCTFDLLIRDPNY